VKDNWQTTAWADETNNAAKVVVVDDHF